MSQLQFGACFSCVQCNISEPWNQLAHTGERSGNMSSDRSRQHTQLDNNPLQRQASMTVALSTPLPESPQHHRGRADSMSTALNTPLPPSPRSSCLARKESWAAALNAPLPESPRSQQVLDADLSKISSRWVRIPSSDGPNLASNTFGSR